MRTNFVLPSRQIHLDFHTGPQVPDVGVDFDAREFARTMKRAHVNSVTVFAKCHHGHLYYATKRPERHPGLKKGLDLLGEQVEALHREGIRAPIYLSVQCDEYAANQHPDWIAMKPDSAQVKWGGRFAPGWQILDMSSPYQDYLAEQTAEVLRRFKPVDGIFFDMCWDQPSCSKWAVAGMTARGLDPRQEADRERYAREVAYTYMARFQDQVKATSRQASVYFNSRVLSRIAGEIQYIDQVEIEALPTGGWGYLYFPKNVRFARGFAKPYLGMTARFHKSWADFGGLKPEPALEFETSQMLAHGAKCSIGDQMHPRGTLDRAAYALIGRAYRRVAEREPWTDGAVPVTQVGVFQAPSAGADEGAVRMLAQLRQQFDVLHLGSDLARYELLVLPDAVAVDAALAKRLRAFVRAGGRLLASGTSGLSADGKLSLLPELAVAPAGASPFATTYLRFGAEIGADVPDSDHVMYERGWRVKPARGGRTVARVVEPYFDRAWDHFCSHHQTPGAKLTTWAVAVLAPRAAYVAYPIFTAFANHGNQPYRLLVRNLLAHLLPRPLLTVDGPTGLEATVTRQERYRRTIVHLLYYPAERRTKDLDLIEDVVPLRDLNLSAIRLPRRPHAAYLAPTREAVPFAWQDGVARARVPEMRGHAMVVFE